MALEKKPGENMARVALWSSPRSCSTVLTKCLSAIDGIEVFLELYTSAALFRGTITTLTDRETPLPVDLVGNEAVFEEANALWEKTVGYRLFPRRMTFLQIKEDLENVRAKFVFIKEMATNSYDPLDISLPMGFKHTFLIREPSRVYVSSRREMESKLRENAMLKDTEYDMVRDDPLGSKPMRWYENQHRLWKYVKDHIDPNPIIIDAVDLLSNPRQILRGYCEAVGLPYHDGLLNWEPTSSQPKNVATAGEKVFEELFQFYARAFASSHFEPPRDSGTVPRDQQTDDVICCVEHSMPFYDEMYRHRLVVE